MPAARYWKLAGIDTLGGAGLSVSELALFNEGVRIDAPATLTASDAPLTGALGALRDGQVSSAVSWSQAASRRLHFSINWEFPSAVSVDQLDVGSTDEQTGYIRKADLMCSDDGVYYKLAYPIYPSTAFTPRAYPISGLLKSRLRTLIASLRIGVANATFYHANQNEYLGGNKALYFGENPDALLYQSGQAFGGEALFTDLPALDARIGDQFDMHQFLGGNAFEGASQSLYCVVNFSLNFTDSAGNSICGISQVVPPSTNSSQVSIGSSIEAATAAAGAGAGPGVSLRVLSLTSDAVVFGSAVFPCDTAAIRAIQLKSIYVLAFTQNKAAAFSLARKSNIDLPEVVSGVQVTPSRLAAKVSYMPGVSGRLVSPRPPAPYDVRHGGPLTVRGNVKQVALPENTPLRRKVRLYNEQQRALVREGWSDPSTGDFEFAGLKADEKYTVLAYDQRNHYRALVVDRIEGAAA